MKKEIRVIGIDDAPFDKFDPSDREVLVVGTIYRGGDFMDGLVSTKVEKDGDDATVKLIEMINNCKFKTQLQAIFLDGIGLGGFNIININVLSERTGLPVIVIMRDKPDKEIFQDALKKLGMERKIQLLENVPDPISMKDIFVQFVNIEEKRALEMIEICSTRSNIPEPIRAAHIIASGIIFGESTTSN